MATVRFGLTTPVVTLVPRRHAAWEESADADAVRAIALAADRLGFEFLTCSDHVAIPAEIATVRGGRYYDPFATLGFIAAITERIRLATHVLVLPYHHPLEVAKRIGTLDRLSKGRVVCGVGVGSLRAEFELLGVDFDGRGPRYEEALQALRAALGRQRPDFAGLHYVFRDFIVDPAAVQPHLPLWLGGRTSRSLRRALRFADGWDPFGFTHDQLQALLTRARMWPEWQARSTPLELILTPERLLDLSTADGVHDATTQLHRYVALGATMLNLQFRHTSCAQYIEQLETFAAEIAPRFPVSKPSNS